MFFPPSDGQQSSQQIVISSRNSRKKRRRKVPEKKNSKKEINKKKNRFASTMTSWAENFTAAATWQLKHELAYWKAKAKSLEYENQFLHNVIRQNCVEGVESGPKQRNVENVRWRKVDNESLESESNSDEEEEQNEDEEQLEVSEEFIEFLKSNMKYKEDARRERERYKAKNEALNEVQELEAGPSQPRSNNSEQLQMLYGENWKRIAATEMSVQSHFMSECDRCKPSYWPNIPFNFS